MNPMNRKIINKNQRGFTLLEAMIALVIFSVGLLGLAGMQMTGMQSNHSAMMRTIATLQSYDMAERIRSNRVDNYAAPAANTIAEADIATWNQMNGRELPSGQGQVRALPGGVNVIVLWDEDRSGANGTNCNPNDPNDLECIQLNVTP